jgi:hypothetical protein
MTGTGTECAAQGDQGLASLGLAGCLQRQQFGLDGREPFHRAGEVDRQIGQYR